MSEFRNFVLSKKRIEKESVLKILKERSKNDINVFLAEEPYIVVLKERLIICDLYPETFDVSVVDENGEVTQLGVIDNPIKNFSFQTERADFTYYNVKHVKQIENNIFIIETDNHIFLVEKLPRNYLYK